MKLVLKTTMILLFITMITSCKDNSTKKEDKPLPSLCECLTSKKSSFNQGTECREVYKRKYGTSYPDDQLTTNDYFDCGGN